MKVFITGIRGFIAGHLRAFLQDHGYLVYGSSSKQAGMTSGQYPPEKIYQYKLGEPVDEAMFAGMEVVIHCAHDFEKGALRKNIEGTIALAEAAINQQVGQQIFISSLSSRPDAQGEYGKAKWEIEGYFKNGKGIIIRPGTVLGIGGLFGRMVRLIRSFPAVPLLDGGHAYMYVIGIDDLSRALYQVIKTPGPITEYNFYNPEKVTLKEILTAVRGQLKRKTIFIPVPSKLLILPLAFFNTIGLKLPVDIDNLRGFIKSQAMPYPSTLLQVLDTYQNMEELIKRLSMNGADSPSGPV
jgi:nucleoside-diphosphate-sugar epimerase